MDEFEHAVVPVGGEFGLEGVFAVEAGAAFVGEVVDVVKACEGLVVEDPVAGGVERGGKRF